ncbi:guanylate kinase [Buchnera aphidicola (Ceratovacuna keduensis)]|uniref:guanylate kinase n=1 Tax=Buchnera aphidicola TaxID=9 RepID=UPI0031B872CD
MKNNKNYGTCFIFSAPSGTGKSSLLQNFVNKNILNNIFLSISYTTRSKRKKEIDKIHYNFVSKTIFKNMIKKKRFIEYAKVFNNYYGTSIDQIYKNISIGKDIFLDIDYKGANQIKKKIKFSKSIFILPPSKKEIIKRLKFRNQDSTTSIINRMKNFSKEIKNYKKYDYLIINDNFYKTLKNIEIIVKSERLKTIHNKYKYYKLINNLINK